MLALKLIVDPLFIILQMKILCSAHLLCSIPIN